MVDMNTTQVAYTPAESGNDKKSGNGEFSFFGDDGFTFWDFVDMVNPLQHLPVVGTAYRQITGDELDPGARLAGGTLFGGPIGLAASAFDVILEHNSGKDMGEHVVAWFDGEEQSVEDKPTMMAKNDFSNPNVASFAPIIPQSEADAFAAGEASLRMAELQEFMNPVMGQEIPAPAVQAAPKGAGSAGTWTPPLNVDHPFPTERSLETTPQRDLTSLYQPRPDVETTQIQLQQAAAVAPSVTPAPQREFGFQAKQSHDESLDALRAFARDMKAQQQNVKAAEETKVTQQAPSVPATSPTQLSQTQDNAWFANMMSQNIDRYAQRMPGKS